MYRWVADCGFASDSLSPATLRTIWNEVNAVNFEMQARLVTRGFCHSLPDEGLLPRRVSPRHVTVYASVSYDKERGRSKGGGIVQFETVDAMNAAVEQMTGSMLDGRSINCRPDAKGNQRGGGYGAAAAACAAAFRLL